MQPDLSICIVNHCTPVLTYKCLQSIVDNAGDLSIEVLLVNNTVDPYETPDNLQLIAIQNPIPLGFAANQNQMLRQSQGRYLLILNSDTIIHENALQTLIRFLDDHPEAGMIGPKLVYENGDLQPSSRNFPNLVTCFLESSGIWQLFRNNRIWGYWYYLCSPHDISRQVDWLTGACLLVRRETGEQVGFFDEQLFSNMYGEDLDWQWRIRKAHWQIWFVPDAIITHLESSSPLSNRTLIMYRGFYDFCAARYPRLRQLGVRFGSVAGLFLRWIFCKNIQHRALYKQLMSMPIQTSVNRNT